MEIKTSKYDLEDRTFAFAKNVHAFIRQIPRTVSNGIYGEQLIRSSSSVGANYIEANESLGKGDFGMRIRISLKESKESVYWLRLIDLSNAHSLVAKREELVREGRELVMIFCAILNKSGSGTIKKNIRKSK